MQILLSPSGNSKDGRSFGGGRTGMIWRRKKRGYPNNEENYFAIGGACQIFS
jgi:hypothetical protein